MHLKTVSQLGGKCICDHALPTRGKPMPGVCVCVCVFVRVCGRHHTEEEKKQLEQTVKKI
jgi:hypothetical protein